MQNAGFLVTVTKNKGYNVGWFKWSIVSYFFKYLFCFIVAIFDLVNYVETVFPLLTSSVLKFSNITYNSENEPRHEKINVCICENKDADQLRVLFSLHR